MSTLVLQLVEKPPRADRLTPRALFASVSWVGVRWWCWGVREVLRTFFPLRIQQFRFQAFIYVHFQYRNALQREKPQLL